MFTGRITPYGYLPGDGDTDLIGGMPGVPSYITITIATGDRTTDIIHIVIQQGLYMRTKFTDHTGQLR